ncbi:hypothetical protein ACROYT_G033197 [Oculina patagonica]
MVRNDNVRFTASSSVQGPGRPIVNGDENDVWCAGSPTLNQYLTVDLGFDNLLFDQVSVQGKANSNRSVSEYYILTSPDNNSFTAIPKDVGVFYGPLFDGDNAVVQNLSSPVQAHFVRFNPRKPLSNLTNYLCMRIDVLSCRNVPAPVDGHWTEWSAWSPCPADKCTNAVRNRTRSCTGPAPAFGGRKCSGASGMNQLCPKDCSVIVDGGWGNWGAWSSCSKTCGNGTATRSRVCDNPLPKNGGRDCVGPAIESQECFVQHCPVDAGWNQWSQWSLCSLTCGGGMRSHNRTCTNPSPQHGGRTCTGNGFEQQMCSNQSCPVQGKQSRGAVSEIGDAGRSLSRRRNIWNSTVYANFIDFEKASDSIHRETLWGTLRHYGIPSKVVNIIRMLYYDCQAQVICENQVSPKKTKHVRMNHRSDAPITLHGKIVEEVNKFTYLGSKITTDGDSESEIKARLSKGKHLPPSRTSGKAKR